MLTPLDLISLNSADLLVRHIAQYSVDQVDRTLGASVDG